MMESPLPKGVEQMGGPEQATRVTWASGTQPSVTGWEVAVAKGDGPKGGGAFRQPEANSVIPSKPNRMFLQRMASYPEILMTK